MTADDGYLTRRVGELAQYVHAARWTSRELLAGTAQTAQAVAATHEAVAQTLEMLAERNPDRAAHYRAMIKDAHRWAEQHRQRAEQHWRRAEEQSAS